MKWLLACLAQINGHAMIDEIKRSILWIKNITKMNKAFMNKFMSFLLLGLIAVTPAFAKVTCELFNEEGKKINRCDLGYYVEMSGLGKVGIRGCYLDVSFNALYETQVFVESGVVRVNHDVNGRKYFTSSVGTEDDISVALPNGNVIQCSGFSELNH